MTDADELVELLTRRHGFYRYSSTIRSLGTNSMRRNHDRLLDDGIEAELLFEADIIEEIEKTGSDLLEAATAELADIVADDTMTLWQTDTTFPFGLVVAQISDEERMVLEIRDDELLCGLLVNRTTESVRWARKTVQDYQQDATRVGLLPDNM